MPKKILVLMKRFGSNKDMVKENFGREIRLFEQLAGKYSIDFICPDYHLKEDFHIKKNGIDYFVVPVSFLNPFSMLKTINSMIKKNKYDVIIPTSEPLLGIIGFHFAEKYNIPIIYEVQDNYEMYDSYRLPFVSVLENNVIKNSNYVFYSNYPLMEKFSSVRKKDLEIIENGIDLKFFRIISKKSARKSLKIGSKIKLVAYTGSISKDRGVDMLIGAIGDLWKENDKILLLLSGKVDRDVDVKKPWIIYRKFPERSQIVCALNASDVLVIASTDNPFTKYSFPQKLFEYMAVNVPIVATSVGDVVRILKEYPNSLCRPGDVEDLKNKISLQLKNKKNDYRKKAMGYTWEKLSGKLDKMIVKCLDKNK